MTRGEHGDVGARRLSRLWGPVGGETATAGGDETGGGSTGEGTPARGWVDSGPRSGPDLPARGRHLAADRASGTRPAVTAPAAAWRLAGVPAGLAAGLLAVAVLVVVAVLLRDPGDGHELVVDTTAVTSVSATTGVDVAAAPGPVPVTIAAPTGGAGPAGSGSAAVATSDGRASVPAGPVVVHVDGAVHRPGVVTLPVGGRVADAVDAAGGTTVEADTSLVNLARPVVDGELVVVPREGETPPAAVAGGGQQAPAGGSATGGGDPLVDINTADTTALDGLPGIGPVLAERIVGHREEVGSFASVDDLGAVSGIGPAVLEDIRDLVTV